MRSVTRPRPSRKHMRTSHATITQTHVISHATMTATMTITQTHVYKSRDHHDHDATHMCTSHATMTATMTATITQTHANQSRDHHDNTCHQSRDRDRDHHATHMRQSRDRDHDHDDNTCHLSRDHDRDHHDTITTTYRLSLTIQHQLLGNHTTTGLHLHYNTSSNLYIERNWSQ